MRFLVAGMVTVGVLVLHGIFLATGQYSFSYADLVTHGLGGFGMGLFGLAIWYEGIEEIHFKKRFEKILKWWILPIFVLGFVGLIGIAWEWHEYLLDRIFPMIQAYRQPSIPDTMLDYFMDLVGAAMAIIFGKRRL